MRTFTHPLEVPWECYCTKEYIWSDEASGRVVIDIDGGFMLSPYQGESPIENIEEAIQLNYSHLSIPAVVIPSYEESEALCKVCNRFKHRIVPNPYYRSV